jgi:hypothetical protein
MPAWPASSSFMPEKVLESGFEGLLFSELKNWKPNPIISFLGTEGIPSLCPVLYLLSVGTKYRI